MKKPPPDGWVILVPMLPDGLNVHAFKSEDHAREIFDALGGDRHGVILKPIFFVPDMRR